MSPRLSYTQIEARMFDYLADALDDQTRAEFEEFLATHRDWAERLERERAIEASLQRVDPPALPGGALAALKLRVRERIDAEHPGALQDNPGPAAQVVDVRNERGLEDTRHGTRSTDGAKVVELTDPAPFGARPASRRGPVWVIAAALVILMSVVLIPDMFESEQPGQATDLMRGSRGEQVAIDKLTSAETSRENLMSGSSSGYADSSRWAGASIKNGAIASSEDSLGDVRMDATDDFFAQPDAPSAVGEIHTLSAAPSGEAASAPSPPAPRSRSLLGERDDADRRSDGEPLRAVPSARGGGAAGQPLRARPATETIVTDAEEVTERAAAATLLEEMASPAEASQNGRAIEELEFRPVVGEAPKREIAKMTGGSAVTRSAAQDQGVANEPADLRLQRQVVAEPEGQDTSLETRARRKSANEVGSEGWFDFSGDAEQDDVRITRLSQQAEIAAAHDAAATDTDAADESLDGAYFYSSLDDENASARAPASELMRSDLAFDGSEATFAFDRMDAAGLKDSAEAKEREGANDLSFDDEKGDLMALGMLAADDAPADPLDSLSNSRREAVELFLMALREDVDATVFEVRTVGTVAELQIVVQADSFELMSALETPEWASDRMPMYQASNSFAPGWRKSPVAPSPFDPMSYREWKVRRAESAQSSAYGYDDEPSPFGSLTANSGAASSRTAEDADIAAAAPTPQELAEQRRDWLLRARNVSEDLPLLSVTWESASDVPLGQTISAASAAAASSAGGAPASGPAEYATGPGGQTAGRVTTMPQPSRVEAPAQPQPSRAAGNTFVLSITFPYD